MTLLKLCLSATAAAALAMSVSSVASAAPVTPVTPVDTQTIAFGTYQAPGSPAFFDSSSERSDTQSPIVASFGNTISGADTSFTDTFTFGSVYNALGSGSVSTSASDGTDLLTINSVMINGVSYSVADAEKGIGGIKIAAGPGDAIVISGETGPQSSLATFSGTATLSEVSAAPEPAAWMLMIGGIGFMGAALRRRQRAVQFA
jgi:hypothetical protein